MATQQWTTPGTYNWTVPDGVSEITLDMYGARGYDWYSDGGHGGRVKGTFPVTVGETLQVRVAAQGPSSRDGGQASDIRQGGTTLSDRIAVAAGGGGSGYFYDGSSLYYSGRGGNGGPDTGEDGGGSYFVEGKGGTQTAGGGSGSSADAPGDDGTFGYGGNGAQGDGAGSNTWYCGHGGDGWYGGGGGAANDPDDAGAGGGGSNYVGGLATVDVNQRGGSTEDGSVTFTYTVDTAPTQPGAFSSPTSSSEWSGEHIADWGDSSDAEGDPFTYRLQLSTDNGGSWSTIASGLTSSQFTYDYSSESSTTGAKLRARSEGSGGNSSWRESPTFTIQHNVAPNAPTLTNPINGATIDRSVTNRFSHNFDDPDAGDSQSKFDIQIRLQGTTTNVVDDTNTTTNEFYDLAGGTLGSNGDYEWRVRTYDSQGVIGPWSAWEPFSAATAPDPPTITDPVSGQVIPTEEYLAKWSTPQQESYQWRRVEDNAGSPNPSVVYADSGEQVSATDRDVVVTFPTNNRWEYWQLRVKYDGLWSDWSSARGEVSYTTPAVPTLVITEEDENGRILLDVTNPAPTGDQPNVSSNDLFRREQGEEEWTRIATGVVPSGSYYDHTPRSGQGYEYQVRAFGDNGVSSYSAATATPGVILRGSWLHDPRDPAATIHQFIYNAEGGTETWEPEMELKRYAGRTLPVAEYGEHEGFIVDLDLALDKEKGEPETLRSLAGLKSPLCYRDAAGRKAFVVIPSLPRTHRFYGADSSVNLVAIDYDEAV